MKTKRKNVRVKVPVRQAVEIEMTLRNARDFCGRNGAAQELMDHLASCVRNMKQAVDDRNRVVGLKESNR